MTTDLRPALDDATGERMARRLLLVWQNPQSRRFIRVARLDEMDTGRFAFSYEADARTPGFAPLAEFPDLDRPYVTERLPAFFGNRVMDRARSNYAMYRNWLDVAADGADTPFEVMLRTGAGRATDTFHVVEDLREDGQAVTTRFFVSGIRHVPGAAETIAGLAAGATLELRPDHDNAHNPLALLLDAEPNPAIGYVPDWLVDDVTLLLDRSSEVSVIFERVNLEAPVHLRLLCRLSALPGAPGPSRPLADIHESTACRASGNQLRVEVDLPKGHLRATGRHA
jgi:hypothetical protein